MKPCEVKRVAEYHAFRERIETRKDEYGRNARYYSRLGRLSDEGPPFDPNMMMSRAMQIAGTWRTYIAWHLANKLGWRHRR